MSKNISIYSLRFLFTHSCSKPKSRVKSTVSGTIKNYGKYESIIGITDLIVTGVPICDYCGKEYDIAPKCEAL